jgi:uncharacterized protein with GYD domain
MGRPAAGDPAPGRVREVTLALAVARQLAEPAGGDLESYYWMSGHCDRAAIVSLPDWQAARLQSTIGPTGR